MGNRHVTKQDIVKSILEPQRSVDSVLPRLAFNVEEQQTACKNCGSVEAKTFSYNASHASGTDSVIFEWEPDLMRIIVKGVACTECNYHRIMFEYPRIDGSSNDPDLIENVELGSREVVSESSGQDPV